MRWCADGDFFVSCIFSEQHAALSDLHYKFAIKLCDPSLTHAMRALEMSHYKTLYKSTYTSLLLLLLLILIIIIIKFVVL